MKFVELCLVHKRGCIEHHIASGVILGEGDAVADAVEAGKEAHPAVESVGQTTVRRCAIFEGIHEETKLVLFLFGGKAQGLKYLCL